MAAKKKKINPKGLYKSDEVLVALKERYFKLYEKENIGKTPQITATLDKIEGAIKKRKEEIDALGTT